MLKRKLKSTNKEFKTSVLKSLKLVKFSPTRLTLSWENVIVFLCLKTHKIFIE